MAQYRHLGDNDKLSQSAGLAQCRHTGDNDKLSQSLGMAHCGHSGDNDRLSQSLGMAQRGHCGDNDRLSQSSGTGLADTEHYERGSEEQTPGHIFKSAPLYEEKRRGVWTYDTLLPTQLGGFADGLRRTASIAHPTGLMVLHKNNDRRRRRRRTSCQPYRFFS